MHVMGMMDERDNPKCWPVHSSRKIGSTNNLTTNQVFATKGKGNEEQRLGDLKKNIHMRIEWYSSMIRSMKLQQDNLP